MSSTPPLPDQHRMWRPTFRAVYPYVRSYFHTPAHVTKPGEKPIEVWYVERTKVAVTNPHMSDVRVHGFFRRPDGSLIRRIGFGMILSPNSTLHYDTGFPKTPLADQAIKKAKSFTVDDVGWLEIFGEKKLALSAFVYSKNAQLPIGWTTALHADRAYLSESAIVDERYRVAGVDENAFDAVQLPTLPERIDVGNVRIALSVGAPNPNVATDQTQIIFTVRPEQTMRRAIVIADHKMESTAVDRAVSLVRPSIALGGGFIEFRRDPGFKLVHAVTIQDADMMALAGRTLHIDWLAG